MAIVERGANVKAEPLPHVMADQSQLTLLFQNLIGNALKYCDAPTPEVHVRATDRGNMVEFSVEDNGLGIDEKFHDRIFQIFQRLHNRREYTGNGIGLALCKRIVQRFEGDIWVKSMPGAGSTFFFTLKKGRIK